MDNRQIFFRAERNEKFLLAHPQQSEQSVGKILFPEPKLVEYSRLFFPVLLIVLLLRAFVAEPFRIPSGSMKPTFLEGDFVLVNKFTYGLRLPVTGTKIVTIHQPKRGEIIVFRYPVKTSVNFIKRVVGLPGDKIRYEDKTLYINGQRMPQTFVRRTLDEQVNGPVLSVMQYSENLDGIEHSVYHLLNKGQSDEFVVPQQHYFVMGDNRDNSLDSRVWGFVSDDLILGKAIFIWMSWDSINKDMRWDRIGIKIR